MKRKNYLALAASVMFAVLAGLTASCTDNNDNPATDPTVPKAETDAPEFDENNVVVGLQPKDRHPNHQGV